MASQVNFNGTQFVVTNSDDFAWHNAEIVINDDYKESLGAVAPGEVLTMGAATLADKKGNRFNPFTMKPLKVTISADEGYYFGGW